jgi:hypothetical protein
MIDKQISDALTKVGDPVPVDVSRTSCDIASVRNSIPVAVSRARAAVIGDSIIIAIREIQLACITDAVMVAILLQRIR